MMVDRQPIYPIHPGEVLAGELEELDMTAAEPARSLHIPFNTLKQNSPLIRLRFTSNDPLPLEVG